ncbi:hypothetical protein T4B_7455 [Trichinella pseudospiralis]|uniref:Uncharacterized protein n=1 Tax=Trichinella pseudospiralis TaxID=6337 RepID=A0A0V1IU23_TRIPS|nr:hypothetical protein T4A_13897 [Trichinella pseudospiralis]KRZ26233.1 hypothetical protein T4B_7455 [Trichinella pseudospiralis]
MFHFCATLTRIFEHFYVSIRDGFLLCYYSADKLASVLLKYGDTLCHLLKLLLKPGYKFTIEINLQLMKNDA